MPAAIDKEIDFLLDGDGRYTLIGHRICPYVQRVVIVLNELNLTYKKVDIDIDSKPNWIRRVSPTLKVPVLVVDRKFSIFESGVICNYLDTIGDGILNSPDPLESAIDDSWIAYAGIILDIIARIIYRADNIDHLIRSVEDISNCLDNLEKAALENHFECDCLTMVNVMYAPVFRYLDFFSRRLSIDTLGSRSNLRYWSKRVLGKPAVISSVPDSYEEELITFIGKRNEFVFNIVN